MNVRDSEVIAGLLHSNGYKLINNPDESEIIIFNTCSVRQHAEDKVWSEIGRYKNGRIIGVVGCMAQNYKEKIFERSPNVDFVVGPGDIHKIPQAIEKLQAKGLFEKKIWETQGSVRPEEIYHSGFYEDSKHAYVVISEGCSNFCSYCVVPYVRGPLHNRNYKDIIKEIEEAVKNGVDNFTLLGQNVNAYKSNPKSGDRQNAGIDFIQLLYLVNEIQGLKEFGFITSHPKDASPELFKAMAECQKLKKYLHLPVQSGSDKILKKMNRGYDRKRYFELADNYRKIVQGSKLTSDIIVGFPGETNDDFLETLDLVEAIKFNAAFIFKYSPRPNTAAAMMIDDVLNAEKEKRHKTILEKQKEISKKLKDE